jgi:hypothetical protein
MADSKTTAEKWGEAFGKAAFNIIKIVVVLYVVILFVFKGTWDLLVPTLFPGAVQQGLVAERISWWTAFFLAGAVSLLAAFVRWGGGSWLGTDNTRNAVLDAKVNAIATHLGIDLDAAVKGQVAALARAGKKIEAIALYRSHTGADLVSAKAYVEELVASGAAGS